MLRASEAIWGFEEPELDLRPLVRRPLLIVDEQITQLAHTDKRFTPEQLLERTQSILTAQGVPVQLQLLNTCWLNNQRETRPRLVASLASQPATKIVFGVDYLGQWASIVLQVGIEPDPLPDIAAEPLPPWKPPVWLWIVGGVGLLLTITMIGALLGIPMMLFAGWMLWQDHEAHKAKHNSRQRQRGAEIEADYKNQQFQKLFRTFRVDDARLFTSAMTAVCQTVVDDIVESGGEVTRVSGGRGGFIDVEGMAHALNVRHSDAANLDI